MTTKRCQDCPTCPCCGHQIEDYADLMDKSFQYDGQHIKMDCEQCEAVYKVFLNVNIRFDNILVQKGKTDEKRSK